jgi:hypothetical protein
MKFYRSSNDKRGGLRRIRLNVHHGYTGGKLAGAKALNMQRWLWTHNAHVVIFGHSHNTMTQTEAVEELNKMGKLIYSPRIGCYGGTFLRTSTQGTETYSERKGYLPLPLGGVRVRIRPFRKSEMRRIILETYV